VEQEGDLYTRPAANIVGKIEVRGLGIIEMPHIDQAPLRLIVDLDQAPERHPDPWPMRDVAGFSCPALRLHGLEASAPIKVELAIQTLLDNLVVPMRL
jgi:serine kinase of HPr protein (carbohydrate metabolism regulator)